MKLPVDDGVNTPVQDTPVPDQVPPLEGEKPVNVVAIGWLQSEMLGPAFTVGKGFTVTVPVPVFEQPVRVEVPVTV